MSDISKCIDVKCPSKNKCWRYVAPSSPKQSYSDFDRPEDATECESFWKVDKDLNPNPK